MDISIKVTYKSEGLQKLRKAAGLSQSQLADLAGIKVQVLQQYERGARDINGAKELIFQTLRHEPTPRAPWVPFAGVHAGALVGATATQVLTDEETLELLKKYEEH